MPEIDGNTYSELNIYPADNDELVVALIHAKDEDVIKFAHEISIATAYINDKFKKSCTIKLLVRTSGAVCKLKEKYNYDVIPSLGQDINKIIKFAKDHNVDVIYSKDKELIHEIYKEASPFELADSIEQLELEIEAFLTGKNIPWSLGMPIWNSTWASKSMDNKTLMSTLNTLLNAAQGELKYNPSQVGFTRALVNKAGHIRHCEEMLISLVQKKNYAARNCLVKNSYGFDDSYDYSFELKYHLGNYYFLISGCLDIIGRLLSSIYEIDHRQAKPNIERSELQSILKNKSKDLYDLYSSDDINKWMIWLKRRRNYVAHESATGYSDVLKPKGVKLSETAVETKVSTLHDWGMMRLLIGEEAVDAIKNNAEFFIRLEEDNEVLTKDAMLVSYYNNETKSTEESMFHPLVDIKIDYEKIETILKKTANTLINSPTL